MAQSVAGGLVQRNGGGGVHLGAVAEQQMASSVSSAEEPLSVADVADLLHPQYAIITGERESGEVLRVIWKAPKCRQLVFCVASERVCHTFS